MESAVVMAKGPIITAGDLPPTISTQNDIGWIRIPLGTNLEEAEKIIIRDTLSSLKGNKSRAADVLTISRKTLHRKLAGWGDAEEDNAE
jgi:DNA-binding NtrC family response regulator